MNSTIQELEDQYKLDGNLLIPLSDTSEECYGDCHLELTKLALKQYKESVAKKLNIKNEKIISITEKCSTEYCQTVLSIYNQMELLPKKELDVLITLIEFIKDEQHE